MEAVVTKGQQSKLWMQSVFFSSSIEVLVKKLLYLFNSKLARMCNYTTTSVKHPILEAHGTPAVSYNSLNVRSTSISCGNIYFYLLAASEKWAHCICSFIVKRRPYAYKGGYSSVDLNSKDCRNPFQ